MKQMLLLMPLLCAALLIPQASDAATSKASFEVSSNEIVLGESLGFWWDVPGATDCYLYSPTSEKRNIPDSHGNIAGTEATPTRIQSDWQKGKKVTYELVCLDESRQRASGNHPEIFKKKIVVSIVKKHTKAVVRQSLDVLQLYTVQLQPQKDWIVSSSSKELVLEKTFKGLNIEGSITVGLSDVTWDFAKEQFATDMVSPFIVGKVKKGSLKINGVEGAYLEYDFDGSHHKSIVFTKKGKVFYVMAQTPTSKWSSSEKEIEKTLKTLVIFGK